MTTAATIERPVFAGHETFPLRYTWLRKAVVSTQANGQIFLADDAVVRLGVGKNMVRAIRHWGLVCGVLEEQPQVTNNLGRELRPTTLGTKLLGDDGWDPFLEDPITLWILHHELVSSPAGPTTWYWVFNHLPQVEFTKSEIAAWLGRLAQERGWTRVSPASLKRDIDVFLRTYVPSRASRTVPLEDTLDSPLVELGLIREFDVKGGYRIQRGEHATLPDAAFAYSLARFLQQRGAGAAAIPIQSIAFAPGSPGRVFALTEDALMHRLERIEAATDGRIVFHDTAGLRQILVQRAPDPTSILAHYFRRQRRRGPRRR